MSATAAGVAPSDVPPAALDERGERRQGAVCLGAIRTVYSHCLASRDRTATSSPGPTRTEGPSGSQPANRSSRVATTSTPFTARKSAATARRMAWPSAAHEAGNADPASPPPVTHS